MMSGIDATPTRSPGAFTRFTLAGPDDPALSVGGTPWPQPGTQQPPGFPQSYSMAVGSTPGQVSDVGEPTSEATSIEAQIAAMTATIAALSEQLQKLANKAAAAQQPQEQQQPQPQQQQPPQRGDGPDRGHDPWQRAAASVAPPGGAQHPARPMERELAEIDKKDVTPPSKYKGDLGQWRHWYAKLSTFLARRDSRWADLMNAIRMNSKDPYEIGGAKEQEIFHKIGVQSEFLHAKFKSQLYEYLETYTEGHVHAMVIAGGTRGSLEVFRQFCDEGFSARDRNLRKEYRKVMQPKQSSFENLKKAILDWETELAQYELSAGPGTSMLEKDRVMCLEDMCPDILQQHLESKENIHTYAEYKLAIYDYLANRVRWTGRNRLNWLGLPEDGPQEDDADHTEPGEPEAVGQVAAFLEQFPQLNAVSAELHALVKGKFNKKGSKAGGKGNGGGSGGDGGKGEGGSKGDKGKNGNGGGKIGKKGRTWYDCGSEEHIAAECPQRKARVAAGGPERLPKGGGKGAGGYPSQAMWGKWNPGPSPTMWKSWHPAAQARVGMGQFGSFGGKPQQLYTVCAVVRYKPGIQRIAGAFRRSVPAQFDQC